MKFWAVVPAAGKGTRMGAELPKQYLPLAGKTVIEQTLSRLCAHAAIEAVVVAVAENDSYWPKLDLPCDKPVWQVPGGGERCHSVLNALDYLAQSASMDDWVLVHDAARPCVRDADLQKLVDTLREHPVGGLLAVPVRDTMKRSDADGNVYETVNRAGLWHALTPQMFRLGPLREALSDALDDGVLVTDEAMAMERSGLHPHLVEGCGDNIKITRPQDLILAEFFLTEQAREDRA